MTLTTRKMIPLRNRSGDVIAEAIVDAEDYDQLNNEGRWSLSKRGGYAYRKSQVDWVVTERKMHRVILGQTDPKILVDHRDRNPLNNTRDNLRICTHRQNSQNRRGKSGKSSSHRGVFWDAGVKKWRAQHMLDGQTIYIGIFDDEGDAAEAARAWREIHMPFNQEVPL